MPDRPPEDHPSDPLSIVSDEPLSEIHLDHFAQDHTSSENLTLKNMILVLAAKNISHWQIPEKKPQRLLVKRSDLNSAKNEIELFLKENRKPPPPPERFNRQYDNTLQTLSILLLIGIFHNMTYLNISGFGHTSIDWLQLGRADADLIRAGEWWRIITALTLHADVQHLMGNLLIGGYFIARLCRMIGSGVGWSLTLWSGILGNAINALVHTAGHRSIGASTALFGAIGAAGMIGLLRRRQIKSRFRILPVAAAAGLLAMLGAGGADGTTDIGAHLYGFISGLALGALSGWLILRYGHPSPFINRALATVAFLTPVGAWLFVLSA
jgi:membrane associated rhomboid family serine protease